MKLIEKSLNPDKRWYKKTKRSIDKNLLNLIKKQGWRPKDRTWPPSPKRYIKKELIINALVKKTS